GRARIDHAHSCGSGALHRAGWRGDGREHRRLRPRTGRLPAPARMAEGTLLDLDLDAAVADLATRFRAALDPPPQAGVTLDAATVRSRFEEPLPERGQPLETILAELEERAAGGLAGGTGGRYFGYVTGGSLPAAAIAE